MGAFEWPGFFIALFWVLFFSLLLVKSKKLDGIQNIFYLAVFIRIVGVLIYHYVSFDIYGGSADGVVYYRYALEVLDKLGDGNFEVFFNPLYYRNGVFLGANFVAYYGTLFLVMCGESYRGTFLLANFLGLLGLLLLLKTFMKRYPLMQWKKFSAVLLVFPSLWFWAASISKEVVVLLGLGIVVYYYYSKARNRSISLIGTFAGLAVITSVRPQMILVVIIAMVLPEILGKGRLFAFRNIVIIASMAIGFTISMSFLGIEETSVDSIEQELAEGRSGNAYGGSLLTEEEGISISKSHIALVNFLFRPFPWEIRNFTSLISGLEIIFIYFLIYSNYGSFKTAILNIRKDKLLMMSLIFIFLYAIAGGLVSVNMGLIARVRIFVYPFLFMLIYARKKNIKLIAKLQALKQQRETLDT